MTSIYPSSSTNSNSSTSSANLLRISGMASGIDTDSVVKAMVSNYQNKIDKANKAKQLLQWKQEAYRDIIKGAKGLQEYFDATSSKYILGNNSLNINTAVSDKTSVASATAGTAAQAGTYSLDVTQLAVQAKVTGDSLDSMVDVTHVTDWKNVSLKVGNTVLDTSTSSVAKDATVPTVVASINSQIAAASATDTSLSGVSASYVSDGSNSYIKFTKSSTNNSSVGLAATYNNGTTIDPIALSSSVNNGISSSTKLSDLMKDTNAISFNLSYDSATTASPVSITAASSDTLQSLIDTVKSKTSGAVTMTIDDITGSISFVSKSYGSTSSIKVTDTSTGGTNTISDLGIKLDKSNSATSAGEDATVKITAPGQTATTTTQSSNQFTINGMSYNLVNTGTTNVTVTADADTVVNNIKSFIKDYNTIMTTINTKLTEKKNNDYPPLTDEQKSSMSETQITAWEAKAKVGVLRNDDYLSDVMSQLRGIFSSAVYSSYDGAGASTNAKVSLSFGKYGSNAIGIDTSSEVGDCGQLVIKDETKLRSVIENNLDDFKKMFIGTTDDSKLSSDKAYIGSNNYMEDGLLTRMDNILQQYVGLPIVGKDGTYTSSGSMNIFVNKQYDYSSTGYSSKNTLPDKVYAQSVSISKLKTQMSNAQNRYYAQFAALEKAMNTFNSQQSSLSSMISKM